MMLRPWNIGDPIATTCLAAKKIRDGIDAYLIGQNFDGQNFCLTKLLVGQNFLHFPKFRQFCQTKIFVRRSFVRNLLYHNSSFYHATKTSQLKSNIDT